MVGRRPLLAILFFLTSAVRISLPSTFYPTLVGVEKKCGKIIRYYNVAQSVQISNKIKNID